MSPMAYDLLFTLKILVNYIFVETNIIFSKNSWNLFIPKNSVKTTTFFHVLYCTVQELRVAVWRHSTLDNEGTSPRPKYWRGEVLQMYDCPTSFSYRHVLRYPDSHTLVYLLLLVTPPFVILYTLELNIIHCRTSEEDSAHKWHDLQ